MQNFYYVTACVLFAVFGLCIGSFLNVVVYRLPRGMNLAKPASHCPACDHPLAWYDNIPLLSFLLLKGRCRYCGAPISPRYFIVELSNCLLWLVCALHFFDAAAPAYGALHALLCAAALSTLLAMALCDMEEMFIPDSLQVVLLVVAGLTAFTDPAVAPLEKLYGLLLGGGVFLFFYCLAFLLFGREGLGFGDVKLMACVGLLLGWKATVCAIVLAIAAALADLVVRRAARGSGGEALPLGGQAEFAFAPHLAIGAALALFCGNALAAWYASAVLNL